LQFNNKGLKKKSNFSEIPLKNKGKKGGKMKRMNKKRKIKEIKRFRSIFGIRPSNKAVGTVIETLKSMALKVRDACDKNDLIQSQKLKEKFQEAVDIAKRWGFRVGSSIRWI